MKVLVSGSNGLIGRAFMESLFAGGHEATRLTRGNRVVAPRVLWNPVTGSLEPRLLEGFDAVVHLAGENIAGRWTPALKEKIRDSRVKGTAFLAQALAGLARPPRVFVCASAVGYYGDRGEEVLTEESGPGEGFLPEVCRAWESAGDPAARRGIRVVHLRFGVALSRRGGALAKMLLPFRLGLGGRLGSGRQWWSWVSLEDARGAILHAIQTETLSGPVNVTAPAPVTNAEFTRALGRALRRPTLLPLPAFLARLALGEMADSLLLASARAEPQKLLSTGYRFRHPTLSSALPVLVA
jgi:hypothetical protein